MFCKTSARVFFALALVIVACSPADSDDPCTALCQERCVNQERCMSACRSSFPSKAPICNFNQRAVIDCIRTSPPSQVDCAFESFPGICAPNYGGLKACNRANGPAVVVDAGKD